MRRSIPVRDYRKFTSREAVDRYFSGSSITCLLCGEDFKSLATHLVRIHGTSVAAYKEIFGLARGRGLVASDTAAKCRASCNRRREAGEFEDSFAHLMRVKTSSNSGHTQPSYRAEELREMAAKTNRITQARAKARREVLATCENCGVEFKPGSEWQVLRRERGLRVYCSPICVGSAGNNSHDPKTGRFD